MNLVDLKQREHHERFYQDILDKGPTAYDGFINPKSIWHFMHVYCLDWIKVFFQNIPKATFLTVGDGYCGREAGYIKTYGHYVHASDCATCLIEMAKMMGLVNACSRQDLNCLGFENRSFDYVLAKETLHHMSNPYTGLYEMLRVAGRGVILIEPNGDSEPRYASTTFEPSGNFLYTFSSNELMKVGIAYGYEYFVVTYSIVFYGPHNEKAIMEGRVCEEMERLIGIDNSTKLTNKPLLIFFFLRKKEDFDIFSDPNKFIKLEVRRPE